MNGSIATFYRYAKITRLISSMLATTAIMGALLLTFFLAQPSFM